MRRASAIQKESQQIETVGDLTGVFESIASTKVAKIKNKVELSKEFFELLWKRYSSIRIDPRTRITHQGDKETNPRKVFVIISAEAGLSGDIDQRLIETMLKDYDSSETDIVVLGTHGANQLKQGGIPYKRYFQVPTSDDYVDVSPVIDAISNYSKITVYYEEYISLGVQGIKKLDLHARIREMSEKADEDEEIMTAADTIFEPSLEEIADLMENAMMNLAFSQAIMESGLAQDASRFNAMATAKKRAWELMNYYRLDFHRAKRSENDRRSREVMVGLKRKKRQRLAENG
jgi:F-type H+-transporting ATPase subunit gamma